LKKAYIVGVEQEDLQREEKILVTSNLFELSEEKEKNIVGLVETDWLVTDDLDGLFFYLTSVVYNSEATFKEEEVIFLTKADGILKAVTKVREEVGPSFEKIKSIEKLLYRDFNE